MSEPNINHDNVPTCGIMVSMYVSFTQCLSHPGFWDSCTPWIVPCISVYWHAHVRGLKLHTLDCSLSRYFAMIFIDEDREVNVQARYKRIHPTETVELQLTDNLPTCLC